MGATTFGVRVIRAQTAQAAFKAARQSAQYERGHGGYTGTIAEKTDFIMVMCPVGTDPIDYANELIENRDRRIDDKWGPAGCIACGPGEYYFFGWASE
jgi:hypothetical protein